MNQPIAGLYQLVSRLRGQVRWNREKARRPDTDPRLVHEANVMADSDESKAAQCEAHIRSDEAIVPMIELIIHDLQTSSIQSAYRTLAIRDLECASGRLRRELGARTNMGHGTSNIEI